MTPRLSREGGTSCPQPSSGSQGGGEERQRDSRRKRDLGSNGSRGHLKTDVGTPGEDWWGPGHISAPKDQRPLGGSPPQGHGHRQTILGYPSHQPREVMANPLAGGRGIIILYILNSVP